MEAPLPIDEESRLETLYAYEILDTAPEREFDDITFLASSICETPVALISLVDRDRQWFKSKLGVEQAETKRNISFCGHAILQEEIMVVEDASLDKRFQNNPLVSSGPCFRFYAGAPLNTSAGHKLGTLCVFDHKPRTLDLKQKKVLQALSRQVITYLEMCRVLNHLNAVNKTLGVEVFQDGKRKEKPNSAIEKLVNSATHFSALSQFIPICAECKKVKDNNGNWHQVEEYFRKDYAFEFTHGYCPGCFENSMKEVEEFASKIKEAGEKSDG